SASREPSGGGGGEFRLDSGSHPMFKRLIPREVRFYDYFERQSDYMIKAAALLNELVHNFQDARAKAYAIKEVEHQADPVTHQIAKNPHAALIAAIARADLSALPSPRDEVLDYIEAAVEGRVVYRIKETTSACPALAAVFVDVVAATDRAIRCLRTMDPDFDR